MTITVILCLVLGGVFGYLLCKRRDRVARLCSHPRQRGIYGDEIHAANGNRAVCLQCFQLLPYLPPLEREA